MRKFVKIAHKDSISIESRDIVFLMFETMILFEYTFRYFLFSNIKLENRFLMLLKIFYFLLILFKC